jgi:hypothetical protein
MSFDEDSRREYSKWVREYSKWVSEINILLIQIVYCLLALLFVSVFSNQNWVKSERRTCPMFRLNLDTLDALMRVSLNSLGVEIMD